MKLPFVSRAAYEREIVRHGEAMRECSRVADDMLEKAGKQIDNLERRLTDVGVQALAQLEHFTKESERAEARYADLMASYRLLKLQGFVEQPIPRGTSHGEGKIDPIQAAINRAARGDPALKRQMLAQLEIDRAAKLNDVEILQRIERGNRPAEEMA